jgi:Flp pilus assembly protein TadG
MKRTVSESLQASIVRRASGSGRIRARRGERGAQLVELVIVLPIMLVFTAATVEFGLYYNTYVQLSKATRYGARYLSGKSFTPAERLKTTHLVVCGQITESNCPSGSEVVPGLADSNVVIDYIPADPNTELPDKITVRIVNYTYDPLFDLSDFIGGPSWSNVPVSPSTTMAFTIEN